MTLRMDRLRFLELLAAVIPTGVALLLFLTALYLQSFDPVNYFRLVTEDFYGEYATALAFLLAGLLFAVLACRRVAGQKRLMWALMALGLTFVGMEELSWGQRILGFSTPQFLAAVNLQAELTLHNVRALKEPLKSWENAVFFWLAASLLLPILRPQLHQWFERYGIPLASAKTCPIFLLAAVLSSSWASGWLIHTAEISELLLGLGVAFLAVELLGESLDGARPSPAVAVRNALFLLLVLTIFTTSLVAMYGGSLKTQLHRGATKYYPKREMYDQAEAIFDYIYRHPEVRRADTPLLQAAVLIQGDRHEEAEATLRKALARESSLVPRSVEKGAQHRRIAQIQLLLGLEKEAGADFEQSLRFDRQSLTVAATEDDKARLLWSIAKTLAARGDKDAALRAVEEAVDTAQSVALRHRIREWVRKDLPDL